MNTSNMRVPIILILYLFTNSIWGQIEVLTISQEDLKDDSTLSIVENAPWIFKKGHDLKWASGEINEQNWEKKNPFQLTKSLTDENGNLEGWFRLKFKLDSSLKNVPLKLGIVNFGQAIDLYLDGDYLGSRGSTGKLGQQYIRAKNDLTYFVSDKEIIPEQEHTVAIYYRHKKYSQLANLLIRSATFNFNVLVVPPDFYEKEVIKEVNNFKYSLFTFAVCLTLCLLFWIIYLQNRTESIIKLISLFTTALCFILFPWEFKNIENYLFHDFIQNISFGLILGLIVLIIARIFAKNPPNWKYVIVPYVFFGALEFHFLRISFLGASVIISAVVLSAYYIISARKRISGPQWAIVIGLSSLLISFLGLFFYMAVNNDVNEDSFLFFFTGIPLSFIVYISMRIKEIISDVEKNAEKVIEVTEEKRMQALNQKNILEIEVAERTKELRESLETIKSTQAQLIQAEKMASLGELTAGIAHEIQNPLNFVNNFSEVSEELIEEMDEEILKGDLDEIKAISTNLKHNLSKISHHGKRADSIVKGMLMHSRTSKGEKVPTDINALCDEFLRLSYHGLRAKDRTFNADFETDFDPSIPKIEVVPQDIGRVLLNLINNAFQAVSESRSLGVPKSHSPKITIQTKNLGNKIEITVSDNGPGIPDDIKDKIFQPFFTTKPTGQGTGLGLSLAYDIVKAHGGELEIISERGKGAKFIITLPVIPDKAPK